MEAILKFNLPEESEEHKNAVNGSDWKMVVTELDEWLRSEAKYKDRDYVAVDELREKIREIMHDNGLIFAP